MLRQIGVASRAALFHLAVAAILAAVVTGRGVAQDDFSMPGSEGGMSGFDFDSARMSFFNQADLNGDVALSPDEMSQAMAHGGSPLFDGTDLNGDGTISFDEYIEHGNQLFTTLDTDGDGILGAGEM